MPRKKSRSPANSNADLIAAAYRVLATRTFSEYVGNPTDPESGALQALLDAVSAAEGSPTRYVVHCQACPSPHSGLKHGAGPTLGAVGAPCTVPGCSCPGYRPRTSGRPVRKRGHIRKSAPPGKRSSKSTPTVPFPASLDPEGWRLIQQLRRALGRELAANSAAPKRFAPGSGIVDDLLDYTGIPYEPSKKGT